MNNYYEILEVSPNASKEIIEKAYRVLAKKYHPDLQEEHNKESAEQKMKLINEAYDVLSDDIKRKEYDEKLQQYELQNQQEVNESRQYNQQNTNQNYYSDTSQNYSANNSQNYNSDTHNLTKEEIKQQKREEKQRQRAYQEEEERAYRNYLRSLGYKVKERWTWKRFVRLLKVLGVILIIILLVWLFPPTRKLIKEIYRDNPIIQVFVDIIGKIIIGIGKGIGAFFSSIFGKK